MLATLPFSKAKLILTVSFKPLASFNALASTFVIAFAGTFVTDRIVEPRLGKYTGKVAENEQSFDKLSKKEIKKSG